MAETPVRIILESWEYEWANHVGIRRFTENWGRVDAQHYDRSRMEDDRTAQVAACVCELAVAKYANRYWSGSVWKAADHKKYRDLPDVGRNIEVRRLRTKDVVPIRQHQLGKGLKLFAARPVMPELREVDIYGWIDHDEAWEFGDPADYGHGETRVLHYANFKLL